VALFDGRDQSELDKQILQDFIEVVGSWLIRVLEELLGEGLGLRMVRVVGELLFIGFMV
jgi:hypothetical protein